uniref:Uncharacterized protein n=1 Tax=Romanomermis culicivorax TaxID=13658 RepID=A0A915LAR8_ROMCU
MIDELTTSQQAEAAGKQRQIKRIVCDCAHLNFDPMILQQATGASQQIAQVFRDYFHPRYLRPDPHSTGELTAVLLSWMCDYYKYYRAKNGLS